MRRVSSQQTFSRQNLGGLSRGAALNRSLSAPKDAEQSDGVFTDMLLHAIREGSADEALLLWSKLAKTSPQACRAIVSPALLLELIEIRGDAAMLAILLDQLNLQKYDDGASRSHVAKLVNRAYGGKTPLLAAIKLGNAACVKALLRADARVTAEAFNACIDAFRDNEGARDADDLSEALTQLVAIFGNTDEFRGALDQPIDSKRFTALGHALLRLDGCLFEILMHLGARRMTASESLDCTDDVTKCTLLTAAAQMGNAAYVGQLLNEGAQIDAIDLFDQTALMRAARYGYAPCVRLLLNHGATFETRDQKRRTALLHAAESGSFDCLKLLSEYGADCDAQNSDGETALMLAARLDHAESIDLLIAKRAGLEIKDSAFRTALMWSVRSENVDCAGKLLKAGANIEARNGSGRTPLMEAAALGNAATVSLLIENGAELEAKDLRGRTALTLALLNNCKNCAAALIKAGAKRQDDQKPSPQLLSSSV